MGFPPTIHHSFFLGQHSSCSGEPLGRKDVGLGAEITERPHTRQAGGLADIHQGMNETAGPWAGSIGELGAESPGGEQEPPWCHFESAFRHRALLSSASGFCCTACQTVAGTAWFCTVIGAGV